MIGSLRGLLVAKAPPQLVLEVGGVGYEVEAPMSTFYTLPPVGRELQLLTHLVVREDAHVLYGFATGTERQLFRDLLRVTGVGPKLALAILSGSSVEAFTQCVLAQDATALTRIPGVGRKTAERLLVEMRDRLQASVQAAGGTLPGASGTAIVGAAAEAQSALVALGYKPAEAARLLQAARAPDASTEDLIRAALQGAARES
ncbi:MAG TPA: Holliday junction branch migration protein RuvA [Steroidobacteraceae bacterium]|nr:Holliday junction branch migration protein RuvA [Steroidobacteraceae bacterium]HQW10208.1 Holliday junction branch migration protein RuvA [Steroidobacteraceae bacterium]HQX46461.1 Holliday junction branch migration protein RuvA [Steroidobacteraceae bacterium]HQX78199.1 Holliday junction branch migration protein RuvA [Steroidobacteraceae bacterium]HQZ81086.1 Holliday junction branch migration protein RuvA [Steroidobacteraceae bacterium]